MRWSDDLYADLQCMKDGCAIQELSQYDIWLLSLATYGMELHLSPLQLTKGLEGYWIESADQPYAYQGKLLLEGKHPLSYRE